MKRSLRVLHMAMRRNFLFLFRIHVCYGHRDEHEVHEQEISEVPPRCNLRYSNSYR